MKKALRRMIVPLLITFFAISTITLSTVFILDSSATVGNHFQAGNLDLELERTYLEQYRYEAGEMVTNIDRDTKAFTKLTFDNIFGISSNDVFVPTAKYTAKMKIKNTGSLAFNYYFELKLTGPAKHLASQLKVSVYDKDGVLLKSNTLDKGVYIGSKENPINTVNKNSLSEEFTITIEFLDDRENPDINNNTAKNETIKFDMIVHAVQLTNK